jgi:hypothetical protein
VVVQPKDVGVSSLHDSGAAGHRLVADTAPPGSCSGGFFL